MFPTQFTGASFTWERKKLGDVAEKVIQKNNNNAFKNVLTNSAEYGIISQRDFFERNIANKNNISTYYIVQNDDFVYNPRISNLAPYGPINRNKTGYTGIISPLYYVFRVLNINTAFIEWYFKTTCWHKFMYQHGDSGARSDRFSIKDNELKKLPIKLPADDMEQEKIAKTLTSLDNTLQLHERKCEELTLIKKSLLQKLFPKEDKIKPEIRYKNFSDAWEQRKLGEVATFSKGTGYSKQDLENDGTPIILYGRMYTNYELVIHSVNTFTTAKEKSIYSNGGEVIVPASGETAEDISVASVVEQDNVLLGGDLNIIHTNKNVEPVFLALSITNGEPHKDMAKRAQGKSVVHLHNSDLAQIKLSYPSKDEQKKIDSYFLKLDSLIALYQRKPETLKLT